MKVRRLHENIDRLNEIASLVAKIPPYKQLAAESGYSTRYIANVMSKLIRLKRAGVDVPRETLLDSLCSEKAFGSLIEKCVQVNVNISTRVSED